jgi:hypothetical protein
VCVYVYIVGTLGLLSNGLLFLRNDSNSICTSQTQDHCFEPFDNLYYLLHDISKMAPKPIKLYSHAGVSLDLAVVN